ncbi:ribulose-phosphate 3-epimerase [Eubacterium xylanophilum]|uniref:ribulose-phosphate 3-epimerase n=1 Tax=Eubacterium xylanophilum TaxID=39497 RepID=UPI00047C5F31|nr:ribulose-phosphate 3-epimerase [Eubacterium xylanophilum]
MTYKLAPSILAADISKLGEELEAVKRAGADYIHIDIMDGMFVPNISFGITVVEGIRKCVDTFFDVHLMVHDPIRYIRDFVEAGADGLTVHYEACDDLDATIDEIKSFNKKVGIAIKPMTDVSVVLPYMEKVDMILVMTVEPGFGGQKMRKEMFEKIKTIRSYAEEIGHEVDIEVDGGVGVDNLDEVLDSGANVIVAGTKIFKGDIVANMDSFKSIINKR